MTAIRPHISIDVVDLDSSRVFYEALFNTPPEKTRPGYVKFSLTEPLLNFSLNEREHGASGSLNHLGIEVASTRDVLMAKLRLEDRGLLPREEMSTNCCYALQDKIWVTDPDGNSWEIFTVTMSDSDGELSVASDGTCCTPQSKMVTIEGVA